MKFTILSLSHALVLPLVLAGCHESLAHKHEAKFNHKHLHSHASNSVQDSSSGEPTSTPDPEPTSTPQATPSQVVDPIAVSSTTTTDWCSTATKLITPTDCTTTPAPTKLFTVLMPIPCPRQTCTSVLTITPACPGVPCVPVTTTSVTLPCPTSTSSDCFTNTGCVTMTKTATARACPV